MRLAIAIAAMLVATTAQAQTTAKWAGKYFCKSTASGGVAWQEQLKEWRGTSFKTNKQFVVSITEAPKAQQQTVAPSSSGEIPGQYNILITQLGESRGTHCNVSGSTMWLDTRPILIYDWGFVRCDASLSVITLHLGAMRFMEAYQQGFWNGEDNTANTPYIEIGNCARIE